MLKTVCRRAGASPEQGEPGGAAAGRSHPQASPGSHGVGPEELVLLSQKPLLFVANVDVMTGRTPRRSTHHVGSATVRTHLSCHRRRGGPDIAELHPDDRPVFLAELGLLEPSIERLIRAAYRLLRLSNFFTAGEREVHVWTCRAGDTAPVAAGRIQTDREKGFIRMEVIRFEDLIAHGSEAAVARAGKQQVEGRTYEVQDGDIVAVRFNGR